MTWIQAAIVRARVRVREARSGQSTRRRAVIASVTGGKAGVSGGAVKVETVMGCPDRGMERGESLRQGPRRAPTGGIQIRPMARSSMNSASLSDGR